jgi:hypothetical protein
VTDPTPEPPPPDEPTGPSLPAFFIDPDEAREKRLEVLKALSHFNILMPEVNFHRPVLPDYPADHAMQEVGRLLIALGALRAVLGVELRHARMALLHAPLPPGAERDPHETCECGCAYTVPMGAMMAVHAGPYMSILTTYIIASQQEEGAEPDEADAARVTREALETAAAQFEVEDFFMGFLFADPPDTDSLPVDRDLMRALRALSEARSLSLPALGRHLTTGALDAEAIGAVLQRLDAATSLLVHAQTRALGMDGLTTPDDLSALNLDAETGPAPADPPPDDEPDTDR